MSTPEQPRPSRRTPSELAKQARAMALLAREHADTAAERSGQAALAAARLPGEALRANPFNPRVIVVRLFVYGLSLGLASLILPGFEIRPVFGREIFSIMILAAIFGVVVAIFKPIFQFIALPFLLETAGLVVLLINIAIFGLFDAFAGSLTDIQGAGYVVLGGLVVGFFAFLFENLLGVPPPILSDIPPDEETGEVAV